MAIVDSDFRNSQGAEQRAYARWKHGRVVYNGSGSDIAQYALVYVSGFDATTGLEKISLADADVAGASAVFIVVNSDGIKNGKSGVVEKVVLSSLTLNTNGATVGDPVYLSTTAGGWTLTPPTATNSRQEIVGRVTVVDASAGQVLFDLMAKVVVKTGTSEMQTGVVAAATAVVVPLGLVAASASNAVYTVPSAFSASSVNSSVAPGTQPTMPRNLVYRLTPNTGSSGLYSGGTIIALGSDILGASVSESVAVTALNTVSSGIVGSKCFGSVASISYSNVSLHTASSSASTAISFHVGVGNVLGLVQSVQSTNAVPVVYVGTKQVTAVTAQTGAVPLAGVSATDWNVASYAMAVRYLSL